MRIPTRWPNGRQIIGWKQHAAIGALVALPVALITHDPFLLAVGAVAGIAPDADLEYSAVSRRFIAPVLTLAWGAVLLKLMLRLSPTEVGWEAPSSWLWLLGEAWQLSLFRLVLAVTVLWFVILSLGHRGPTHRREAALIAGMVATLLFGVPVGLTVLLGWAAHLLADGVLFKRARASRVASWGRHAPQRRRGAASSPRVGQAQARRPVRTAEPEPQPWETRPGG